MMVLRRIAAFLWMFGALVFLGVARESGNWEVVVGAISNFVGGLLLTFLPPPYSKN